jgi:VWFA-related protein
VSKKAFFALLALLCLCVPAISQTQSDDVVRITTNLVQIDAVVTKNGKPVKDLKAEDFEIFEDGRRQEIISFAYISNVSDNAGTSAITETTGNDPNKPSDPTAPPPTPADTPRRRVAFVVDDYGLSQPSMAAVRRQLRKFIDQQLKPTDLIAILRTSRAGREVLEFTNDKGRLIKAWEQLEWNQCSRVGVKAIRRVGDMSTSGCGPGTGSYDDSISSMRAIVRALGQNPGRKSMVIFSDDTPLRDEEKFMRGGSVLQGDADSRKEDAHTYSGRLRRLAELAIRSSVVIYGVDTGGVQTIGVTGADATPRPGVSGSEGNRLFVGQLLAQSKLISMRQDGANMIAKETGGFLVHNQNEFQFDKILEDQSGYYLIGYRPSTETFDKKFHKFRARVKKSGHDVRTRSGFFGMSEEDAKRLKPTTGTK